MEKLIQIEQVLRIGAKLLQIGAAPVVTNRGKIITNWGRIITNRFRYYKLWQLLQIGAEHGTSSIISFIYFINIVSFPQLGVLLDN